MTNYSFDMVNVGKMCKVFKLNIFSIKTKPLQPKYVLY